VSAAQQPAEQEEQDLNRSLSEAGGSTVEFTRAIENHLAKYPTRRRKGNSNGRWQRLRWKETTSGASSSMANVCSNARWMTRRCSSGWLADCSLRAMKMAPSALSSMRAASSNSSKPAQRKAHGRMSQGRWQEELNQAAASALVLQARATGRLGQTEAATALAERSYKLSPGSDAAREQARWLEKAGKYESSIQRLADAFTITDSGNTELQRAEDRARMGELYKKLHGSEKGLGDIVLNAYDRTARLMAERATRLRQADPKLGSHPHSRFHALGTEGRKARARDSEGQDHRVRFLGHLVRPCRVQHPLYEQVKQRFQGPAGGRVSFREHG